MQFRRNLVNELHMVIYSISTELGVISCSGFELLKGFFFLTSCLCKGIGHIETLLG